MTIVEEYKKLINDYQKELKETEKIISAFDEIKRTYFKKFQPLEKALKDYGSFNGIHDAYGYDFISEKRYQRLCKLKEEKDSGVISSYIDNIINENIKHKMFIIENIDKIKNNI